MRDQNNQSWRKKAIGVFEACELELRRTTAIGMKMIHASKASAELHESYEEVGKLTIKAIKEGCLDYRDPRIKVLLIRIEELEHHLSEMEIQVQDLKKP